MSKRTKPIIGIVGFDSEYYIKVDNIPVPICEKCTKLSLPSTVYSLPTNDKREVNSKILLEKATNLDKVSKYYGKYPIGATVEGKIIEGRFFITKIKKYPKMIN